MENAIGACRHSELKLTVHPRIAPIPLLLSSELGPRHLLSGFHTGVLATKGDGYLPEAHLRVTLSR